MRIRRIAGLVLVALAWARPMPARTPGPAEVLELSLEEAIAQALEHNRDLVKGALDVRGHALSVERARETVRSFRVAPAGSARAGSDLDEWSAGLGAEATGAYGTRVAAAATARQIEIAGAADLRREELRVEVEQPLLRNFGPLVRNEPVVAAGETLLAARRAWERERSALVVRVVELYEELVHLRHRIDSDEAFAARMERLYLLADARERQGRSTRTEVLRMDLQRGEAELRLETDRAQLAVRFQEFADLLGLPPESAFRLTPPALLALDPVPADRALAVALAERPDFAQALEDIATGDRRLRLARRNLLPDLRLSAGRTTFGEGEEWSDAGRFDQEDWFVGLTADLDLNLRGTRLDVARQGLEAEGRRQIAEIARNRLALEVNSRLADCRRTREELRLAELNHERAANRAELARALFEAGRAGADAVSDAEGDRIAAELGELGARRDASVAAYRLLHSLGTLVPAPREILRTAEREATDEH